jgi:hypothetical protein
MILILTTFILTTGLYGALFWLVARRLARHTQENPEAVNALSTHLFLPMFGKRAREDSPAPVVQATLSQGPQGPAAAGSSLAPKRT